MKKSTKKNAKHHAARSRAQLAHNLRPIVDELVERLVDVAWGQVSTKLEVAMSAAMSVLAEPETALPEQELGAEHPAGDVEAPPVRAVRKCTACKQPGHRRPDCPLLAPPPAVAQAEPVEGEDEEDDEDESGIPSAPAPLPAVDRADRFAQIEAAAARRRQEAAR